MTLWLPRTDTSISMKRNLAMYHAQLVLRLPPPLVLPAIQDTMPPQSTVALPALHPVSPALLLRLPAHLAPLGTISLVVHAHSVQPTVSLVHRTPTARHVQLPTMYLLLPDCVDLVGLASISTVETTNVIPVLLHVLLAREVPPPVPLVVLLTTSLQLTLPALPVTGMDSTTIH